MAWASEVIAISLMARRRCSRTRFDCEGTRGVSRRLLSSGMQGLEECDQRCGLRRAQVLAVRRHVPAPLDHLPDELILRQSHRHSVQSRATLSALVAERMAVVALFHLEHKSALPLESRAAVEKFRRDRVTA